jgi:two-component system response regulator AtoC
MENILIGKHPSMLKIRELITMVSDTALSDTALNVLIMGETGTGKEVVARLLHHESKRRTNHFVKVSCAAMPLTLLESELFGYEKGAFTGAVKFKPGKFELASSGVIFLDEIGDMPLILQAKLLQVLQDGEFTRLGGTRDVKVNSWVIAATNHDLEKDIKHALFREDLYYRLNIIRFEIPPLRERREDIALLTRYFVHKYEQELKIDEPFTLDTGLRKLFHSYHWPGNVRELSSVILRLMVGDDPEWIKANLLHNIEADGLPLPTDFVSQRAEKGGVPSETRFGPDAWSSLKALKAEAIRNIEQKSIMYALNMTGWNKRQTAKMLGISYKALFYKMDNLGIRNPR